MRMFAFPAIAVVATLVLAGCSGSDPTSDPAPPAAQSYTVNVVGSHANTGADRTIRFVLSQDGVELGTGSYMASKTKTEDKEPLFTKTVKAGPVNLRAFEGNNPVGTKTIDVSECPQPFEFNSHVISDAVHMYTSCD
ncbi:MAG: hypothetical protein WC876_03660 [Candidatus Thermoplasmatota archaeon]|jgi:hypothetical protein